MKEFLISLCFGIREIPKKHLALFEQIKSCGAIDKSYSKGFRLAKQFIIAQAHITNHGVFLTNIAYPKQKDMRLKHRSKYLRDQDLALVLVATKYPKIIKILSSDKHNHPRLIYLEKKKGKIIGISLKNQDTITLPFSQKSLLELPKYCVLSYDKDRILDIFGSLLDPQVDEAISLYLGGRESHFSKDALNLAQSFGEEVDSSLYPHRRDLRGLDFVSIDPNDAKDFDDVIFWDQQNSTLYIGIADVSEYVTPNTALDLEAKNRCFSLYFPHICHPMLPSALSENLCSLKKNQTKLAMVWEITLHKRTKLPLRAKLFEALITPKQNLSYEEVDLFLQDSKNSKKNHPKVYPFAWLKNLALVTQRLKSHRLKFGFDFYSEEIKQHLDSSQMLSHITIQTPTLAHSLIEECMLLANISSAQMLRDNLNSEGIYRVHNEPTKDRIHALFVRLSELGFTIPKGKLHAQIQAIQALAKPTAKEIDKLIIKAQQEAHYAYHAEKHFGLGFDAYTHFTSPIRRYSDILAHRLLKLLLQTSNAKTQKQLHFVLESIQAIIPILNEKERQIAKIEMDFKDRKYARLAYANKGLIVEISIIDERYPILATITSEILFGARVYVESNTELEVNQTYKASIIDANIASGKIWTQIIS
ncbi:ribonuclease R [uncultured Helicobacter sp.]|uniref:ribonuclease R n=1 Tax=uncultured Helicobacter sp. TaxID=175537 RepID=UPI0027DE0C84|nr:ribonuclease R [uncultured Helicobacter sp.]